MTSRLNHGPILEPCPHQAEQKPHLASLRIVLMDILLGLNLGDKIWRPKYIFAERLALLPLQQLSICSLAAGCTVALRRCFLLRGPSVNCSSRRLFRTLVVMQRAVIIYLRSEQMQQIRFRIRMEAAPDRSSTSYSRKRELGRAASSLAKYLVRHCASTTACMDSPLHKQCIVPHTTPRNCPDGFEGKYEEATCSMSSSLMWPAASLLNRGGALGISSEAILFRTSAATASATASWCCSASGLYEHPGWSTSTGAMTAPALTGNISALQAAHVARSSTRNRSCCCMM